jgi:hypothetical protein
MYGVACKAEEQTAPPLSTRSMNASINWPPSVTTRCVAGRGLGPLVQTELWLFVVFTDQFVLVELPIGDALDTCVCEIMKDQDGVYFFECVLTFHSVLLSSRFYSQAR